MSLTFKKVSRWVSSGLYGEDPLFVDPGASWALQSTSPAVRTGTALSEVVFDFDGVCYDAPPSRGAFASPAS